MSELSQSVQVEEIDAGAFEASVQATTEIRVSSLLDEKLSEGSYPSTLAGVHVLPSSLAPTLICKYRPGSEAKRSAEVASRTSRLRSRRMVSNEDKKPFRCQKCGRGFTLKRNKDRHVNYECGHEPRFQCPYCGLRSKQTSPVYAHIRKKHPDEEVFIFDMKL
ncbi:hypothetical protein KPH14_002485 [Odynerus spinipes]|uniref:C2H2-type domain-containing protein n=1 Tax=Odynerus spinipes TaxID=1348599 RepID=A0AAD9RS12_9HYME|nr:hypothetical protein KPH14_002485 [Odynerus spinipes]